ncbi:MAG: hypothetical protein RLZZ338_2245 [Cyanobacteriota bacterium]
MSPSSNSSSKSRKSTKSNQSKASEPPLTPPPEESAIAPPPSETVIDQEQTAKPPKSETRSETLIDLTKRQKPPKSETRSETLIDLTKLQKPPKSETPSETLIGPPKPPKPPEPPVSEPRATTTKTTTTTRRSTRVSAKEQTIPPEPPEGLGKPPAASPVSPAVPSPVVAKLSEAQETESHISVLRQYPISPPSEPRQYRAIGLVKGRYTPIDEQFTKGNLQRNDGTLIDSVLLGRVMSLIKNHLDLEKEHLWVVYPRTRQEDGHLHTQIMGVWEPETLSRTPEEESSDSAITTPFEDGYFSIRGEVIYQSQEENNQYLVVKIKQAPRKDGETMKFFKLKLLGNIPEKAVSCFWDFHVQLQGDHLVVQKGTNIGAMPIKKRKFPPGAGKRPFNKRRSEDQGSYRPFPKSDGDNAPPQKEFIPKPIKRSKPPEE